MKKWHAINATASVHLSVCLHSRNRLTADFELLVYVVAGSRGHSIIYPVQRMCMRVIRRILYRSCKGRKARERNTLQRTIYTMYKSR